MEEDPIWKVMEGSILPRYCGHCGTDVGPYEPSEASQRDVFEYGHELPEGTAYYRCDTCDGSPAAPCKYGTGYVAPCGHFVVPVHAKFCWICGADLKRRAPEPE